MTDNHKIEFSFNPTEKQLNEIKDWLIEEMNLTGESFYLNWNSIETAFNENKVDYRKSELVTISKDNETIGFIVWSWHCLAIYSATIEIAAIKQSFRGYGFGTLIVNN